MRTLAEPRLPLRPTDSIVTLPISVIIPVRNEARNLPRCLESLRGVGEVYVVDSNSSDETAEIARSFDATVVQFTYRGGWPKKRQWAMDTLPITYEWLLLLDACSFWGARSATAMQVSASCLSFAAGRADSNAASRTRTARCVTWKCTSTSSLTGI